MSETIGTEQIGERDPRDEREDPSGAGNPEPVASPEDLPTHSDEMVSGEQSGRLEEREQRQHSMQQHDDTFAADSNEATDTNGVQQESPAPPPPAH